MKPAGDAVVTFNRRAARLWHRVARQLYMSRSQVRKVVAGFENVYAASPPRALWMGDEVTTSPLDLWIYQEIVHETHPDLIVAADTSSAPYLTDLCTMRGTGIIHRIDSVPGSSVAADSLGEATELAWRAQVVMVVIGCHSTGADLARSLDLYCPLVSVGCYLVVEATTADPDRAEAVRAFVQANPSFAPDGTREKLLLTDNAGGYLKRLP